MDTILVKPKEMVIQIGRLEVYNSTGFVNDTNILFDGRSMNNCIRKMTIVLDAMQTEPEVTLEVETTIFKSLVEEE